MNFDAAIYTEDKSKRSANLSRGQFFELLLRLARDKYYTILHETNVHEYAESMRLLINEDLRKLGPGHWQSFRDNELYKVDVNDVLKANLEKIKRVYDHFAKRSKGQMSGLLAV